MRIFKLSDSISLRNDGDKYLLFDNVSGNIFKLNELSYEILSLCDGLNNEATIINKISGVFDVSQEKIHSDFNSLIDMLLEKQYISAI
ncbi:MAG: PqqD family protein [Deltaproteobacteria bacterium]|jgi:hypothetical protein|nr:PqqD family protein [Deltaproteobacteria bacterium]